MTDKAVSALTSLTGATTATGDLLYIVDISEAAAADRSKKITLGNLFVSVPAGAEATPSIAAQGDQNTGIYFPAADTVAISTGGTRQVSVDANGRLLIGTTSSSVYFNSTQTYIASAVLKTNVSNEITDLVLINGNNDFGSTLDFARTNTSSNDVRFGLIGGTPTSNTAGSEAGYIYFSTKGTADTNVVERTRITSGGYFKASNAGTYQNAAAAYHELRQNASDWIGYFVNTNATPYGIQFGHITDANSTGSPFFQCTAGAALGTLRAEIRWWSCQLLCQQRKPCL
jgi:hypothetical protein